MITRPAAIVIQISLKKGRKRETNMKTKEKKKEYTNNAVSGMEYNFSICCNCTKGKEQQRISNI